ncbi:MAG: V-type ATP synthase subunit E [Blautia sp.]|nr:V-type ATP synthase subunit E family protein [Blautia sp.]MDD7370714.1 V-type ATP synthase subunit E family protein [Bacillota bacterium]MDY3716445.1 V-type ATP synthase subunit E family protein [Blautia sp.]
MTGLEKMKSQILDEANRSAGEILEQAKKEADAVMAEARKNAEAECQRISEKSEADAESLKGRAESSCDLQKRKAVLKAKQEVISEILKRAYKKMLASDTETYFDIIRKMLNKYVLPEEGEICFSSDDKKRMPDGFEKEIAAIAAAKGGKLIVSKEERNIQGGFVLIYGGIEENCTFKAMFDSRRGELSDKVHALLFS